MKKDDDAYRVLEAVLGNESATRLVGSLEEKDLAAVVQAIDPSGIARALFRINYNGNMVTCSMPNNSATIAQSASVQCTSQSCASYFCRRHSLSNCPLCGSKVQ